ncbi:transcriptional activator NhaR [Marinobacterium mangrovicola]|uniref:LysR family transcriptional regulator n=1 Tax=Marinobacterium mangrovicola TaxID=1476959 RepID=A0A4R1GGU2_9GAMM|nr:transcriptional activator NhaR [Marinobacterium mangrovicola]TCK07288.1 LysR family transcriptional regulator [Marinobacterium mangrovicola]
MHIHNLNFRHLRYFMVVAQEGTIARASKRLNLTPQTISGQLKVLEEMLEIELFERHGRRLDLTDAGRQALEYAEEIFNLGEAMQLQLHHAGSSRINCAVGIADVVPKSIAYKLLAPALELEEPVHLECREGSMESLLGDLIANRVDLILADRPIDASTHVRAYNHLLGETGISMFASPELAQQYRPNFPEGLNGAPLLLPTDDTVAGANIMKWFRARHIEPAIRVQCVDSALIDIFGQAGTGLFCGPSVLESELQRQHSVETLGRLEGIRERYYAISLERQIRHPGVQAITHRARELLLETEQDLEQETKSDD